RLTTLFIQNKKIAVIERNLLKKAMDELKLQSSGVMDDSTVKNLGRMLGASAVVYGTLHDLNDEETEVNARIMEIETGLTLPGASAGTVVKKTWKDGTAVVTPVTPVKRPTGQNFGGDAVVQLAVLLDTSNSMDGLINQARNQLWKIINELITSEKKGSRPSIEVALYEYGNSSLPRENNYIRQILPFTTDLDRVSAELFGLTTNGGDEYCGKAVHDAVTDLNWSRKDDVYKAIFIAGNEPFTQGPVDFRTAAALAKSKNIFVNTIFCGDRQQGIGTQWLSGAQAADGDYTNIDQQLVVSITAPQDVLISQLNQDLNRTYVAYGDTGRSELKKKAELEGLISSGVGGSGAIAERAAVRAKSAPAMAARESMWDAVTAVETGKVKSADLNKEALPAELQKLDKGQLDNYMASKVEERKKIKNEINQLNEQRKAYIAEQEKTRNTGATLDKAIINSVRKQATMKGYQFK
ncbi:MAG: hypothetical protein A3J79_12655, partial [Elusimicrobia bacterium RIFOXYB2_FULL_62_6]